MVLITSVGSPREEQGSDLSGIDGAHVALGHLGVVVAEPHGGPANLDSMHGLLGAGTTRMRRTLVRHFCPFLVRISSRFESLTYIITYLLKCQYFVHLIVRIIDSLHTRT